MRARAQELADLPQDVLDFDRPGAEVHAAGAQLGVVQDVVDQAQQVLAALAQGGHIGPLFSREAGAVQQPGHAQHPVQGGAELVAERCEVLRRDAGAGVRKRLGHGATLAAAT